MIIEKVKENEKLISSFVTDKSKENYAIISALNALDNNNEVQEYFVNTLNEEFTTGELIARLYALLQGLFVSIDSLYALAYAITNSKSFININQNDELRQLKYIRNDVVGHPANRVYENMQVGYCLLPKENIFKTEFSYFVYVNGNVTKKDVNVLTILHNYYQEANNLLKTIYQISQKDMDDKIISKLTYNIYDMFLQGKDIRSSLVKLKKQYETIFNESNKKQHRILWRIALLEKLLGVSCSNIKEKELFYYCSIFQIIKIHELANRIEHEESILLDMRSATPRLLGGFYRLINNNPKYVDVVDYLFDMGNPLFPGSLTNLLTLAKKNSSNDAYAFLSLINTYYQKKDSDMVYAIGILAKRYKKR